MACQRRVLTVDDKMGGHLTNIMKHFSFVKPRFESFVGPRRKYICLLQAIVMLLAQIADDTRQEGKKRRRAEEALDAITPSDTIACGLAADYAEVCLSFIRVFDTNSHDPALSLAQRDEFVDTLTCLFLDGYILAKVSSAGESAAGVPAAKTLTQIAYEQLSPMRTFYYGHKTKVLWNGTAKEDAKLSLQSL